MTCGLISANLYNIFSPSIDNFLQRPSELAANSVLYLTVNHLATIGTSGLVSPLHKMPSFHFAAYRFPILLDLVFAVLKALLVILPA